MLFNVWILPNSGCVILLRCFINSKGKRYNCSQMFHQDCFKSVKIACESGLALKRERRDGKKKPQNRVLLSLKFQARGEKVSLSRARCIVKSSYYHFDI